VRTEIGQLLFREARLLDLTQYEAWLEMLSMRVRYWAPVRSNLPKEDLDSPNLLTLFDDRRPDLVLRVKRIRTGYALSEQPASRTRRLITNIQVVPSDDQAIHVESSFLVTVSRWNTPTRVYSGVRHDRWARSGESWLLEDRRILFDLSTTHNISFIV
jgi:3-phenylpropionate/cinnamic acid dioxygenase small subunit